ncbi:MAG: CusA/CzcA family heavy metal efflux RND transporter [Candidatus Firestonebacteria bacterium]
MDKFLSFVFRQKILIIFITLIIIVSGIIAWKKLPIDAFPDATNIQIMIITKAPGLAPTEVERLITFPVEIEVSGLPNVKFVRSLSKAGLSQVVVIFEDGVDIYFVRQLVFERLQLAKEKLPEGFDPEMGPISTGLGEIYQYTLESETERNNETKGNGGTRSKTVDLTELRTVQDWIIRPQLRSVRGVADINSFGGFAKQYQVIVEPDKLLKYDLTLEQISSALAKNNAISSANYIIKGPEQIIVRGIGLIKTFEDIENIVVMAHEGTPIYIKDIADVKIGHETRWGAVTRDGKGETVCGMIIMLKDSDSKEVVNNVKKAITKIQERLPAGIKINPFYDRTDLIKTCINTVTKALLEGGILIIIVLFLFLGEFRPAIIVCLSLPISTLICFIIMKQTGVTANLMSLGGLFIALGMIADASIVVVENIFRCLNENKNTTKEEKLSICFNATKEVVSPVFFAIIIIILTKIPLFAMQDIEGKMFKPMALTIVFGITGSLIVAFTIAPVLSAMFLKASKKEKENILIRGIKKIYLPILHKAMKYKKITAIIALVIFITSLFLFKFVGTEFLPYLDEGSIALNVVKFPTVSLDESKKIGTTIEKLLLEFPEVSTVVTKTGRAEIAEDPMGPEQNDIFVMLKPKKFWKVKSKTQLIEVIDKKLEKLPGVKINFSQPIALRVNELISGVKSDVAIKIFGYDLELLGKKAEEIEHIISDIKGAKDVKAEQISGFLQLDIDIDRKAIARYGINVSDVNEIIETAIGGKTVGTVFEGDKRFNLAVRFPENRRNDENSIGNILVSSPEGQRIPLQQIAKIKLTEVPNQISRENGMRRVVLECNVRGRDIGSFVAEAQKKIQPIERSLPPEYFIDWGGQFENQERAMKTLFIIVPIVIFLIFVLLLYTFGALKPALLVMLNLPFALVGGILGVLLFKITLSVSAVIGFLVLLGTAVANGVVLVAFIIQLRKGGLPKNKAIVQACEIRLRPLLLTSLVAILGLIPLLWATGPGAEIQKPLAIVVLSGLVSSGFLALIVLPALYSLFEKENEID